ncbi:hypothetical protein WNY97_08005 [Pseudoalteromonas fuliginea]|uniref:hypothetical protein n=1 Tax=Pseudoalteromonas fuliginea TaxID=1872678 RepID=UPI00318111F2
MLDIGVVEKSGNFVGSVIHLPSNTLVKNSSKTAEKAIYLCLRDLSSQISKLQWFYTQVSDGVITKLSINGLFDFSSVGFCVVAFEEFLDDESIILSSLHQFSFNNQKYSGYICNSNSYQKLIEAILSNPEFELSYC